MTNAELIRKIRAEIERLAKRADRRTDKDHASHNAEMERYGEDYWNGYGDLAYALLSFLSTLESEEPTLTWGDVQLLDTFILECAREEREGKDWGESEEFYTEVLRRYNDFVKRTIPEIVSKIHEYNENDRKDSPEN